VFNHASRGFWQFHHTLENGAASPYADWFHFDADRLSGLKHWGAYPSPEEIRAIPKEGSLQAVGYRGWWDLPALPKFNTDSESAREFLLGVAEHWTAFGIDGWRLDVPGEINDDGFWREFRSRVRAINPEAYLVGEIWGDARRWLQGDQFDASMNYAVTAACVGFFAGRHLDLDLALKPGGFAGQLHPMDAPAFADRIDHCLGLYDQAVNIVQLNPLDTHDMPRFLSCAGGDLASLRLGLSFLMTYVGTPCIFYGDEIGLEGGQDPDCRRSFPWAQEAWNNEVLELVRRLVWLRRSRRELRWGTFERLHAGEGVYAFMRRLDDARTVVALNAAEEDRSVDLSGASLPVTDAEILFGDAEVLDRSALALRIPARSAVILGRPG